MIEAEAAMDADQLAVVDAPIDSSTLVLAGPGTGKTATLVARAKRLADADQLSADELVILSFTRAVVYEISKKASTSSVISRLAPRTFDAFALRICLSSNVDNALAMSFEKRLVAATRAIQEGRASEILGSVQHLLLDEIQDIGGERKQFVLALLEAGIPFTAFGDPAQAIYGQISETAIDEIRDMDRVSLYSLSTPYRQLTTQARSFPPLGGELTRDEPDSAAIAAVFNAINDQPTLGAAADLPDFLSDASEFRTAVLCRDNAAALLISRELHERKLRHQLVSGRAESGLRPELAEAVLADGSRTLRRDELERAFSDDGSELPEGLWPVLTRLAGSQGDQLSVSALSNGLRRARTPTELEIGILTPIVVSTIHGAKGLEFDDCVIVESSFWDERSAEEARIAYVALTRARRDVYIITEPLGRKRWWRDDSIYRFKKSGRKRWQSFGVEFRIDDAVRSEPAGSPDDAEADAPSISRRLRESVENGDHVELVRSDGEEEFVQYQIRHETGCIGTTTAEFAKVMARLCTGSRRPLRISNLFVDSIETRVGEGFVTDSAGLGSSGFWLSPRIRGLGEFDWGQND